MSALSIKKQNPANVLEELIFMIYGNPPPLKRANLEVAAQIAYEELLMEVVGKVEIRTLTTELNAGPIPYSTHDLALSVALNYFKRSDLSTLLGEAQLFARMKMVDWSKQGLVAPILMQNFEEFLYQQYKPLT